MGLYDTIKSEKEGIVMKLTTLCYVEKDGKYLMLYRNRKKNDENGGKWIQGPWPWDGEV